MHCFPCVTHVWGSSRLPASARTNVSSRATPEELTSLEQAVAIEWERVLGLPVGTVSTGDSFFELGGESLLALRACAAVAFLLSDAPLMGQDDEPQFGTLSGPFTVTALFEAVNLSSYCQHLQSHGCRLLGKPQQERHCCDADEECWSSAREEVSWPDVRRAARQTDAAAATRLDSLLKRAPTKVALRWCGAAPRAASGLSRFNAFHAAAQSGSTDCLRLLLEWKARATSTEGGASMTPAHYAAIYSSDCLKCLLAAKAPLTLRDVRGQSLIHAAARAGNAKSLELILSTLKGCSGTDRQTPRALRSGEGSRSLLEWSDRWARTAVHWAVLNGHEEALAVLLQHRASPEPTLISAHQMGKRTHMTQETPMAIALRVHGAASGVAMLLTSALAGRHDKKETAQHLEKQGNRKDEVQSRYLLTIAEPRLERLALWEVRERLNASVQRSQCRICFTSAAPPASFFGLKAAEKICAVVLNLTTSDLNGFADAVKAHDDAPDKAAAMLIAESGCWAAVLVLWQRFHGLVVEETTQLTFKVTCRRKGSRFANISSQGLALTLATILTAKHGWRAQVRQPDLEIRVLINDADLLVDLPLLFQPAVRLGGGEICEAGLSAHVAWALARTAELQPGERVLDPMCGRAVILAEAALSWPTCQYLGVELDPEQLRGAARNVAMIQCGSIDLVHGDARLLPLPDDSIDAIVCDIPFGKQYSTIEECRSELYNRIFAEFNRVLHKKTGRMVLLSSLEQEPWVLRAAGVIGAASNANLETVGNKLQKYHADDSPWICVGRRRTPLGFLEAVILSFRRPAQLTEAQLATIPELSDRLWWETQGGRNDWSSLKVSQRPPMQLTRGREI